MRQFARKLLAIAFLPWMAGFPLHAIDADLDGALTVEKLKPKGQYYDATVPDTLDLAERARLTVHGLTSFLNPNQNYAPTARAGLMSASLP